MGRGALLHDNDVRRQDRASRRELQRRFPPGALGVCVTTTFTVVGWSPKAAEKARPAQAPVPGSSFGTSAREAQPKSWEIAVLVGQRLETWDWVRLKSCKTLEEWAGDDAVP